MEKLHMIHAVIGAAGAAIAAALGGWDSGLQCLVAAMAIDYMTGLIVAGIFRCSPKSPTGKLESSAGWKGLGRKACTLLVVLLAVQLDGTLGTTFIRDGTVIAYLLNEVISITENLGLMGVPIPAMIARAIDILKEEDKPHE